MCEHCTNDGLEKFALLMGRHFTIYPFHQSLAMLPPDIQQLTVNRYQTLLNNPASGANIKPITRSNGEMYAAEITKGHPGYRALAYKLGEIFVWYWIGAHREYEKMIYKSIPVEAIRKAQKELANMTNKKSSEYFNLSKEAQAEPPYIPEGVQPNPEYQQMLDNHAKNPTRCSQCGEVMDHKNVLSPSHPMIYDCHKCGHRFNPDNEKFTGKFAQFEGSMGLPSIPPSQPPTDPTLPKSPNNKFDECPQCGGPMSDWEEGEVDAWNQSTETHYTKPSGKEYRTCAECGYKEEQEVYNPRNDPDYQYERMRDDEMDGGRFASSLGAKIAAGEHPSKGEGHKCMKCGKPTQAGWGPTMCAECAKNEKKAGSYFDLSKVSQVKSETCPKCHSGFLSQWEMEQKPSDQGTMGITNMLSRSCSNDMCDFYETKPYQAEQPGGNPWAGSDFLGKDSDIPDSDFGNNDSIVASGSGRKTAQFFDEAIQQPNNEVIPCNRCGEQKPDVEERNSYGIYAGRMCAECAYDSYRDHCGLVKNPDGTYSEGSQGDKRELEDMGEVIEPDGNDEMRYY